MKNQLCNPVLTMVNNNMDNKLEGTILTSVQFLFLPMTSGTQKRMQCLIDKMQKSIGVSK